MLVIKVPDVFFAAVATIFPEALVEDVPPIYILVGIGIGQVVAAIPVVIAPPKFPP
jgi:hypothetical protein